MILFLYAKLVYERLYILILSKYAEAYLDANMRIFPVFYKKLNIDAKDAALNALRKRVKLRGKIDRMEYVYNRTKHSISSYCTTPLRFDGDIVITDPCYLNGREHSDADHERWYRALSKVFDPMVGDTRKQKEEIEKYSRDFVDMRELGFKTFMTANTIYGDWSCSAFKKEGKNYTRIGDFCADAGLVCVVYADEVSLVPNFREYAQNNEHMYCIIPDFHGTVSWKVKTTIGFSRYSKSFYIDHALQIIGKGDKNSISFVTSQTGF